VTVGIMRVIAAIVGIMRVIAAIVVMLGLVVGMIVAVRFVRMTVWRCITFAHSGAPVTEASRLTGLASTAIVAQPIDSCQSL
jgi:hypothetical protein